MSINISKRFLNITGLKFTGLKFKMLLLMMMSVFIFQGCYYEATIKKTPESTVDDNTATNLPDCADDTLNAAECSTQANRYVYQNQYGGREASGSAVTGANGDLSMTIPVGWQDGANACTMSDSNLTASNIKSGTPNSYAADVIDSRYGWTPQAETSGFWKALGEEAKKQNLYWGGDWSSFRDWAHVQLVANSELARVKKESGL